MDIAIGQQRRAQVEKGNADALGNGGEAARRQGRIEVVRHRTGGAKHHFVAPLATGREMLRDGDEGEARPIRFNLVLKRFQRIFGDAPRLLPIRRLPVQIELPSWWYISPKLVVGALNQDLQIMKGLIEDQMFAQGSLQTCHDRAAGWNIDGRGRRRRARSTVTLGGLAIAVGDTVLSHFSTHGACWVKAARISPDIVARINKDDDHIGA